MATDEINAQIRKRVCEVWLPISWSVRDTDDTIAEVKENNAARKRFCER